MLDLKFVRTHFEDVEAMLQKSQIRGQGFWFSILFNSVYHSLFCSSSQNFMFRKIDPTQKIHARSDCLQKNFLRVHCQLQLIS